MAPTYLCRFPGSKSDGFCGSALFRCPSSDMLACPDVDDQLDRRCKKPIRAEARRAARCAAGGGARRPPPRRSRRGRFRLRSRPARSCPASSPLKTEINPLPLMRRLADAGARLALPVVDGRGKPLIMRALAFGDELASGPMGHPRAERRRRPRSRPISCSCRCWPSTARGHRIGYGAGYYDMTIAQLRADEAGHRGRHRLCGAGNRRGAGHAARRAPRSRANGARDHRFARKT